MPTKTAPNAHLLGLEWLKTAPNAHLLGVGEVKNSSKCPLPPHPLGEIIWRGPVIGEFSSDGYYVQNVSPAVYHGLTYEDANKVIFLRGQYIKVSRLMKQLYERNYECVCSV
jgi:hypothetical protein